MPTKPTTFKTHSATDLFPLLEGEELQALVDDIKANGLIESVWVWDDPERGLVLLDGRNRVKACELAGVEVKTRKYTGSDPIGFSLSENLKRRHLTTGQMALVTLEVEKLYEVEGKKAKSQGGKLAGRGRALTPAQRAMKAVKLEADLPQAKRAPQAREKAAKLTGTSGRAVSQAKRITKEAPDLADKVRSGKLALDRADRLLRDRAAEAKRVEQAKKEAKASKVKLNVDIRFGDFRKVLADLSSIDAIITDPPYPGEYLPLLSDLAAWADKVLSPDGILAVLIGQTHLPEVFQRLSAGRPYRWTACYLTEGSGYVSHPRKVQSSWKPLLVYGKGPRMSDLIRSTGDDKQLHEWGQNYDAFHQIVERLTVKGQTVCDPFMGAGTTLLAAHALGRHVVGADIDKAAVAKAKKRLQ